VLKVSWWFSRLDICFIIVSIKNDLKFV